MPLKDEKSDFQIDVVTAAGVVPVNARLVESSNIDWIGWPRIGKEKLMFVQFRGGVRYVYFGVSRQKAVAMANADSSGEFLNRRIKKKHGCIKVR